MSYIADYNIEDDDILDVLNDSKVTGLVEVTRWRQQDENYMKICLGVLPEEWNEESEELVREVIYDYGEDYFIDEF